MAEREIEHTSDMGRGGELWLQDGVAMPVDKWALKHSRPTSRWGVPDSPIRDQPRGWIAFLFVNPSVLIQYGAMSGQEIMFRLTNSDREWWAHGFLGEFDPKATSETLIILHLRGTPDRCDAVK